ncbi:uncharacterized protein METZ01_LOCUS415627, partial [marine metagenome]
GTKPLLSSEIAEKVNFPSKPKDNTPPCIDARTGKERPFLLADLKSELISLSYSGMDRVLTSLEVMGLQIIEARIPNATFKPYTVDRRGKATLLPAPKGSTHKKTKYPCSALPVFLKPNTAPIESLTNVLKGPHASTTGSRFSMVNMASADYGLNESLVAFYHPAHQKRFDNIKNTISKTLDAAPIQVYIESMVLEVNESGLDELGVLYKSHGPNAMNQIFQAGILSPLSPSSMTSATPFLSTTISSATGSLAFANQLSIQIQALIAKGSAEVLSR